MATAAAAPTPEDALFVRPTGLSGNIGIDRFDRDGAVRFGGCGESTSGSGPEEPAGFVRTTSLLRSA